MDNERFRLALSAASRLVTYLPPGTVWSVCVTDDNDTNNPGVFNVYVPDRDAMERMRLKLNLHKPCDDTPTFVSFMVGELLMVSIVVQEEEQDAPRRER